MRLTNEQIEQIRTIGQKVFGQEVRIYLFGSRTSDENRGGDIDLFIETDENQATTFENKVNFLTKLKISIGDQKIDLVFPANLENRHSFKNSILKNRIRLC